MSLVIQANDKKFYESPMWHGVHGDYRWVMNWFERFYLTIDVSKFDPLENHAERILLGWPVKIGRGATINFGVFPPDWESVPRSRRYPITLLWMPPKPTEATPRRWAPMDDLRFCWRVEFPTADIHAYIHGQAKQYNCYLNSYITGKDTFGNHKVNLVRSRLRKQFAAMIGMDLNRAIEEFGNHVEVDRAWTSSSKLSQESA